MKALRPLLPTSVFLPSLPQLNPVWGTLLLPGLNFCFQIHSIPPWTLISGAGYLYILQTSLPRLLGQILDSWSIFSPLARGYFCFLNLEFDAPQISH